MPTIPNAVFKGQQVKTIRLQVAEVSAGVDAAQTAIGSFPYAGQIITARIVNGRETAPTINDTDNVVITLERGASGSEVTFATVTYNASNAFPAINTVDTGLTFTPGNFPIAAGDVVAYTVTQAASADLPNSWTIEVDYI